jgi:nitrate/nitrite transporter NarK
MAIGSDRSGRVLRVCFLATTVLTVMLAVTGAVFRLVAAWFPAEVGAVTGVVGAAGGLGGFFPPLVMAVVKGITRSYVLGFLLLAAIGVVCLVVLAGLGGREPQPAPA